jgi:HK97 family phage prohead protease
MEHLLLKAATTVDADQGTFEAVISTASVDRDGDIVEPSAIVKALTKWAAIGKLMPLAYSHRDPATGQAVIVGHIDPASARAEGKQVIVSGWVDQSTERGAETWRLVKSGTLSFSYGYLVPDGGATKRTGRKTGYHITEIDLYEVSVVPVAPANNDTRVLSFKAVAEQRQEAERVAREVEQAQIPEVPEQPAAPVEPEVDLAHELQEVKGLLAEVREELDALKEKADATDKEPHRARSVDPLRERADAVALEIASDGHSLRRPPKTAAPTPPDLIPLDELKERTRDEMLGVLSGGITE